jgi:hypothetical protein
MSNFLEEFKKAKADPAIRYMLFKKALMPTPEWKAFWDYVEVSKSDGSYRSDHKGFYIIHTDDEKDLSSFTIAADIRPNLLEIYNGEIDKVQLSLVISEFAREQTNLATGIQKHYDQQDTIHWACIGSSIWQIYADNSDEIIDECTVEPGDIFWARKGVTHNVESLHPRAACIFIMHKN